MYNSPSLPDFKLAITLLTDEKIIGWYSTQCLLKEPKLHGKKHSQSNCMQHEQIKKYYATRVFFNTTFNHLSFEKWCVGSFFGINAIYCKMSVKQLNVKFSTIVTCGYVKSSSYKKLMLIFCFFVSEAVSVGCWIILFFVLCKKDQKKPHQIQKGINYANFLVHKRTRFEVVKLFV